MARFWRRRPAAAASQTTEEHIEAVPPPRPRPFWPWLLLLLLLVLGGLAAAWYFTTRDDTVEAAKVPDVVGLQRAEAEKRVQDAGFESEPKQVVSAERPGTVAAQRPEPRTLYGKGGIVVLSVARNPLDVSVPSVIGQPSRTALTRLRGAGLEPRAQTVASRRPAGRVVRQVPDPGTQVPKGSAVVVLVSAGPRLADVPDVVGLSAEDATARLTKGGFRTRINRVAATDPEGTVVAQQPGGGTRAQRGRVVVINVSRGRTQTTTTVVTTTTTPSRATVPDTVGMDEATATSTLQGAGLTVRSVQRPVTDPSKDGIVISQTPAGGTKAARGSTVTIFVGVLR